MGMYDSIMVPCPTCHTPAEFQSKSGDCILAEYSLDDAPDDVLHGIGDDQEICRKCSTLFGVQIGGNPLPRRTLTARAVVLSNGYRSDG